MRGVRRQAPHEPRGLVGRSPPNIIEFVKVANSLSNVEYKISHILKAKNRKTFRIRFRTLRWKKLWRWKKNSHFSKKFERSYLKTKNRKIDFTFVSDYCATFSAKTPIWPLLRGWGSARRLVLQDQKVRLTLSF